MLSENTELSTHKNGMWNEQALLHGKSLVQLFVYIIAPLTSK